MPWQAKVRIRETCHGGYTHEKPRRGFPAPGVSGMHGQVFRPFSIVRWSGWTKRNRLISNNPDGIVQPSPGLAQPWDHPSRQHPNANGVPQATGRYPVRTCTIHSGLGDGEMAEEGESGRLGDGETDFVAFSVKRTPELLKRLTDLLKWTTSLLKRNPSPETASAAATGFLAG